ncbi:MAG: hypothetical protein QOG49_536, partial [Frankiaceae bacterium]|nr:hypothetical protein [Frankiaceae bacterium]
MLVSAPRGTMAGMERPAKARVTDAAIAAAVTVALGGVGVSFWASVAAHRSVAGTTFNAAVVVAFTTVGAVIAAARPGNRVGWLMLSGGVAWSGGSALVDVAHHGIVDSPGSVAGASAYAVVGSACRSVGWYLETLAVPMYFPDGRLAGRRYRWLGPALLVVLATAVLDPLTDTQADLTNFGSWHNPIAPSGSARVISLVAFLGHIPFGIVATVAVVAGLVSRWRRGDALQRQQLTLFAGAAALTLAAVPIAFGLGAGSWIFGAAAFPLPVAIGFAVLARGLYDLRTAANRTLVWLTLSAVVAGTYALVIAGVARLLDVDRRMTSLPWIAAAVIAVSFAPLRDSLQRAVNRITYGRWDEPYDVLAALGTRLEGTADVDRLLRDVVAELHELGLRDVVICDARGSVVAGDPVVNGTDDGQIALTAYGESVGALRYRQS